MYFVLKILKILFTLFRSTCFGHNCAHHQDLLSCTCSLWSHTGPETACAATDDGHSGVRNM